MGERLPTIITGRLADEAGIELVPEVRVPWPTGDLLALLDGWLQRYEPVAVVLHVNSFWFTYESVPERVRRMLGPFGAPLATIGLKAAGNSTLAENPVFKAGRKATVRAIGGDLLMSPQASVSMFGDMIRRIVAQEEVVLLVRGAISAHNSAGSEGGLEKSLRRYAYVHRAIRDLFEKSHVAYLGWEEPPSELSRPGAKMGDDIHITAESHGLLAALEGDALIAAWRDAHGS